MEVLKKISSVRQICLLLSVVFPVVVARFRFIDDYGRNRNNKPVDPEVENDALFLTRYIENHQIQKAQELAIVPPLLENVESFAGYLTVNKHTDSNMFFWLFKSQEGDWKQRPLVIWLNGGPGSSSLFGLFTEVGPLLLAKQGKLERRKYSWNRKCNLVFIDNPVGAGFSFTKKTSGYARNEFDVARDLYAAIVQLYELFPTLRKNKLFITGESYAGKYIPAIAYKIYKMNQVSAFKINLAGLMIGNGWTDPINQVNLARYFYELGLIDQNLRDRLVLTEGLIKADVRAGKFAAAYSVFQDEMDELKTVAGLKGLYNFVQDDTGGDAPEAQFVNAPKVRSVIHVGNYPFNNGTEAANQLDNDVMQSVRPWVEELLAAEQFPVLFYSGQLDLVVAYVQSLDFYDALSWPRADEYHKANRCQFVVGDEVAGYFKSAGTFTEVLVRNAGHMVPTSQPKWAFALFDRFVTDSASFRCG